MTLTNVLSRDRREAVAFFPITFEGRTAAGDFTAVRLLARSFERAIVVEQLDVVTYILPLL